MSKVKLFTTLFMGLSVMHSGLYAEDTRILSFPSGIIQFGDVNINDSKVKTVTVSNEGNATLHISRVRLHKSIQDYYSITNWVGGLEPGQSVDINITFLPNELGLKKGLFYVESDKTNSRDRSKLIKGTGILDANDTVTRILRMCEDDAINCLEDEAEEEFGSVQVGTSATRTVTIYNDGNAPLEVTGMRLHQKIRDMYKIDNPWRGSIPAGESHDVNVTYTPNDTGEQKGRIYFSTNKTSGYNRKELVGVGVSEETPCAGSINIEGTGDYGLVPEGNIALKTFAIKNLGTNPLTISKVYLHPKLRDAFSIDGNWSNVIIPGRASESVSSAYVTIQYDSTTASNPIEKGLFYVTSSSCKGSKSKFIKAEADELNDYRILNFNGIKNFISTDIGSPVSKTLSIVNNGNSDLHVSNIYLHPSIRDYFEIADNYTLPITIPANSSHEINVTYTPTDEEVHKGLIYVKSDNTNNTDGTMVLRGTLD